MFTSKRTAYIMYPCFVVKTNLIFYSVTHKKRDIIHCTDIRFSVRAVDLRHIVF